MDVGRDRRSWQRRELCVGPDDWHAVDVAEWRGALVLLQRGCIELFARNGEHTIFEAGAVLCFDGTDVRAVHNPGAVPALLIGIAPARPP